MSPVWVSGVAVGLGQAEVGDPDAALGVEQQVRRLDVAVDDPLAVGIGQGLGHLDADLGHAAVVVVPARLGGGVLGLAGQDRRRAARGRSAAEPSPGVSRSSVRSAGRARSNRPVSSDWATSAASPAASGTGASRGVGPRAEGLQLAEHHVERLPLDELHRVEDDARHPGRPRGPGRCWCGAAGPRPAPRDGTAPGPGGRGRWGRAGPSRRRAGPGRAARPHRPRPCRPGRPRGGCDSRRSAPAARHPDPWPPPDRIPWRPRRTRRRSPPPPSRPSSGRRRGCGRPAPDTARCTRPARAARRGGSACMNSSASLPTGSARELESVMARSLPFHRRVR